MGCILNLQFFDISSNFASQIGAIVLFFAKVPCHSVHFFPVEFSLVEPPLKLFFDIVQSCAILFILLSSTSSNLTLEMKFWFRKQEKVDAVSKTANKKVSRTDADSSRPLDIINLKYKFLTWIIRLLRSFGKNGCTIRLIVSLYPRVWHKGISQSLSSTQASLRFSIFPSLAQYHLEVTNHFSLSRFFISLSIGNMFLFLCLSILQCLSQGQSQECVAGSCLSVAGQPHVGQTLSYLCTSSSDG